MMDTMRMFLLCALILSPISILAQSSSSSSTGSSAPSTNPTGSNGPTGFLLNVVFSSDIRGRMLPIEAMQSDCTPETVNNGTVACFGGMARRYTFVKQNRMKYQNTLVVDIGNLFYGTSFQLVASPQGANIAGWVSFNNPVQNYVSFDAINTRAHTLDA